MALLKTSSRLVDGRVGGKEQKTLSRPVKHNSCPTDGRRLHCMGPGLAPPVCAGPRPAGDRQRRSALAVRAVERGPAALPPALDRGAADAARLALPTVHEVTELGAAGATAGIDVIAQGAAAV